MDDIPAVLTLVHSAYRGEASRAGWTSEADLMDGGRTDATALTEELADPTRTILLITDELGALACASVTDRGGGTAYFGMFAVRPTAQGAGIGSFLLGVAEEHARALGATRMEMYVLTARPELMAWYVRRGYTPTGEIHPFVGGDERYGVPRRNDLTFELLAANLDRGALT